MVYCTELLYFILLSTVYFVDSQLNETIAANATVNTNATNITDLTINTNATNITNNTNATDIKSTNKTNIQVVGKESTGWTIVRVTKRILTVILTPVWKILQLPKFNSVMKNVATCAVNGAVELVTFYFPAPLIPVIASAAGMLFPFEPIQMLRDKLPVTTYRRAFLTALESFLGTFDKYKLEDNYEFDPYMTQRFRRRMMNYGEKDKPMIYNVVKTNK